MPKPLNSVLDEPRPVPNSKRPFAQVIEHGDALGHARRMIHRRRDVVDRRADVDPLGARGDVRQEDLRRRDVRVLLEKVVLDRPDVLAAGPIARYRELELAHQPIVLGVHRIRLHLVPRHVCLNEQSELHQMLSSFQACRRPEINHGSHGFHGSDESENPCHPCNPWSLCRSGM